MSLANFLIDYKNKAQAGPLPDNYLRAASNTARIGAQQEARRYTQQTQQVAQQQGVGFGAQIWNAVKRNPSPYNYLQKIIDRPKQQIRQASQQVEKEYPTLSKIIKWTTPMGREKDIAQEIFQAPFRELVSYQRGAMGMDEYKPREGFGVERVMLGKKPIKPYTQRAEEAQETGKKFLMKRGVSEQQAGAISATQAPMALALISSVEFLFGEGATAKIGIKGGAKAIKRYAPLIAKSDEAAQIGKYLKSMLGGKTDDMAKSLVKVKDSDEVAKTLNSFSLMHKAKKAKSADELAKGITDDELKLTRFEAPDPKIKMAELKGRRGALVDAQKLTSENTQLKPLIKKLDNQIKQIQKAPTNPKRQFAEGLFNDVKKITKADDEARLAAKMPKAKAAITPKKVEPLVEEARKFKTADEFVQAATKKEIDASALVPTIKETPLLKVPKSLDKYAVIAKKSKSYDEFVSKTQDTLLTNTPAIAAMDEMLPAVQNKSKGFYEAVKAPAKKPIDAQVQKQLTDIWTQAQKAEPVKAPVEAVPKAMPGAEPSITAPLGPQPKGIVPYGEVRTQEFVMTPGKKVTARQQLSRTRVKRTKEQAVRAAGKKEITSKVEKVFREKANLPPVSHMSKNQREQYRRAMQDFDGVEVMPGKKLKDVVDMKIESTGVISSVITKQDLFDIKKAFKGPISPEWVKKNSKEHLKRGFRKAKRLYQLPQTLFENTGLKKYIYDPIIGAERVAEQQKTDFLKRFEDAGLFKKQGWLTEDRFAINKSESKELTKYFAGRQGYDTGVSYKDLSSKLKKVADTFDGIIKDSADEFYAVAKHNGIDPGRVPNYAPLWSADDITHFDAGKEMGDIVRKRPDFAALKKRKEKTPPLEAFEQDYRKVMARYIDGLTKFNNLGKVGPQMKFLKENKEFRNIVGDEMAGVIDRWYKHIYTPDLLKGSIEISYGLGKLLRGATAVASLGLNYASVVKQALTQIPVTVIEKAAPKLKSKFAKDFGINVADLPAITSRKGNVAIADLQGKVMNMFTQPLKQFDRKNAQVSLNALLDKNYKKFLKEGVEVTPEIRDIILRKAQDSLDMWYGGMTKAQLPPAFRTDLGKFLNMFIYPLTSQLNGFFQSVYKAQGVKRYQKAAEVAVAAASIAYMEQAITKLSFDWDDKKSMTNDVLQSLAGNIPILSQIVYSMASDQPLQTTAIISGINEFGKEIRKEDKDSIKIALKAMEVLGMPKQLRKTGYGIKTIAEGGKRSKEGTLLAPVDAPMEQVRSFLRGEYGSLAAQEYMDNVATKSENRSWSVPQTEFLQTGDMARKMQLVDIMGDEEVSKLLKEMSPGQVEEYNRWRIAKNNPNLSQADLGGLYQKVGLDKDGKASTTQYNSYQAKVGTVKLYEDIDFETALKSDEIAELSDNHKTKYVYSRWKDLPSEAKRTKFIQGLVDDGTIDKSIVDGIIYLDNNPQGMMIESRIP